MIEIIGLIAYLAVGLFVGRIAGGHAAWSERSADRGLRGEDLAWGFAAFVGATVAWPVVVFAWAWKHRGEAFLHTPPEIRERQAEIERERLGRAIATGEVAEKGLAEYDAETGAWKQIGPGKGEWT